MLISKLPWGMIERADKKRIHLDVSILMCVGVDHNTGLCVTRSHMWRMYAAPAASTHQAAGIDSYSINDATVALFMVHIILRMATDPRTYPLRATMMEAVRVVHSPDVFSVVAACLHPFTQLLPV